jgi:thiol-disulfide isomerase/thioredoxin
MFKRMTALSLAMALCAGSVAVAQDSKAPKTPQPEQKEPSATLKVGEKAPSLTVENWVKGSKVNGFESGKVYVVEFWATWCPPCVESIPLLTELQKDFKKDGVTVIGVAASERPKDRAGKERTTEERLDTVKKFVTEQGDKMVYTIAFDADRSMSKDWMQAAGQGTIPTAFVVDKESKIAWIGNPQKHEDLEWAVKKALSGGKADAQTAPTIHLASWQPEKPKKDEAKPADKPKDDKAKKPATQDGPTVFVGDKAPELQVAKFVKGDAVTGFEKGTPYVVEFWATWCGPCKESIPHLTELAKANKDKGLKVIGVSVWESDQTKVEPFVEQMGDTMEYIVAMDKVPEFDPADKAAARKAGNEGKMAQTWMKAAGKNGIPTAFIIDRNGKIAWIGHPMKMEEPLEKILAGEWDLEKEAATYRKSMMSENTLREARQNFQKAMQEGDNDKLAEATLAVVEFEDPGAQGAVQAALQHILADEQEYDKGYALGRKILEKGNNNAEVLNALAWVIVDPDNADKIEKKDLELALKAAKRADEVSKSSEAHIVDTLATVHHCKGDLKTALDLQKKAVALVEKMPDTDPRKEAFGEELRARLEEYEAEAKK